jgi:CrcB protein
VAVGGALGAVARWGLGEAFGEASGFPWTTFGINVAGSFVLALLPAVAAVRRHRVLALGLGPGLLGGFTTLSTYAEQSRALLADGHDLLAASYVLGTLAVCLAAVAVAHRLSSPLAQREFEDEEGNE